MRVGQLQLTKLAADAVNAMVLAGRLEASKSGWLLLSVPNPIIQGLFAALDVPGAELPYHSDGRLNAHVSVMRPEELERIGGLDKISERGKRFKFQLGPVQEVTPTTWAEMSRVWFVKVHSPELEALRRSYGLSSRPNNNNYDFHITFAVRKKHVLRTNSVTKTSAETACLHGRVGECADCRKENCPHCGASLERNQDGTCNSCGKDWAEGALGKLISEAPARQKDLTETKSAEIYDINRLLAGLSGKRPELVPVAGLQVGSRSKRDRFGPKRYDNADTLTPIIIDRKGRIIDGRHRVAKVQDRGGQNIQAFTVSPQQLRYTKVSNLQELELASLQKQAENVGRLVADALPQLEKLANAVDAGEAVYWLPTANEFHVGDRPGDNWLPLEELPLRKAANWKEMPLVQMLGGSLAAGALGYGGGAILERLFPERFVERGKLRRTLGLGGLALGALPGAWGWAANVQNARQNGQLQGVTGAVKGLVTPTSKIPVPDAIFPGQYLDERLKDTPASGVQAGTTLRPKIAQLLQSAAKDFVVHNELLEMRQEAVKLASLDFGSVGLNAVPVDAFNNAIWNDVRKGMSAARNPYGTKSPWGDNKQELHTPPDIGVATAGIVNGVQSMYDGASVLSPRHFVKGLMAAGADLATAHVVGSTLGALGGLTPAAQDTLQNMGLWGGLLRGTVGSMLGLR